MSRAAVTAWHWSRLEKVGGNVVIKAAREVEALTVAKGFKSGFNYPELRAIYPIVDADISACLVWYEQEFKPETEANQ